MILLNPGEPRDPVTQEVRGGASVTVRVLDTVEMARAKAEAARLAKAVIEGSIALADLDIELPTEVLPQADPGISTLIESVEIGVAAIVSWSGFGDRHGTPVAPTRQWIAHAMRDHEIAMVIRGLAGGPYHRGSAAGNV